MADIKHILELTAVASGTLNVPVQTNLSIGSFNGHEVRVTGTATLSGNLNISPTGTPVTNTFVNINWEASVTASSGKDVVIFGVTIPQAFLNTGGPNTKFLVQCLYNGSSWTVKTFIDAAGLYYITADALAPNAVETSRIKDDAVTIAKMADLASGRVIKGSSAGDPEVLNLATDGMLMIGDSALGVVGYVVSGDITLTKAGVAAIGAGKVLTAMVGDAAITPTKMSANANKYTRDIAISFTTAAEVGVLNFIMCQDCTIDTVSGTVMSPFLADTGTVVFKNNAGTVMTGSQIDFTTGLVLGNQVTNTVTANNAFTAGQKLTMELSKTTTTSGKANISLCITKV